MLPLAAAALSICMAYAEAIANGPATVVAFLHDACGTAIDADTPGAIQVHQCIITPMPHGTLLVDCGWWWHGDRRLPYEPHRRYAP